MKTKNEIILILKDVKNQICNSIPNSDKIIKSFTLFGSYARNEQNEDSDVDVCLIFDKNLISELNINLIIGEICSYLLEKYKLIFNILCINKEYYYNFNKISLLFKDIKEEGIIIE